MDKDGTRDGYDLWITREVSPIACRSPSSPPAASASSSTCAKGLAVDQGGADAALAASIFHFGLYTISQAKQYLHEHGIPVRPHESQRGAPSVVGFS
jgi:cyclase